MHRVISRRILAMAVTALVAMAFALVLALLVAGTSSAAHPKRGPVEKKILAIAFRAAGRAGDPNPTLIQHSRGTRAEANTVSSGEITGGGQLSYLIAERGHFVLRDVGPGNSIIRGTVITLVVNAATWDVTDFGLQNNYPNLAALGPVTTDWRVTRSRHASGRLVGGIVLRGRVPPSGTKSRYHQGWVEVGHHGHLVAKQSVKTNRQYHFRLRPGSYDLAAYTRYGVCRTWTSIHRDHTTRQDVGCVFH